MRSFAVLSLLVVGSNALALEPPLPKFGPEATPIFAENDYLRDAAAPDYWALSAYYVPQRTTSDCSAAAVVMAMNLLRGLPAEAETELLTEASMLEAVANATWDEQVADDGPGVTFDDLAAYVEESLQDLGIDDATMSSVPIGAVDDGILQNLRDALAENETTGTNVVLVYFNQGVITGDWDGPHISPIGAYDAQNDRVLIMDVDCNWYVPYWTSTETLLDAMAKPISEEHGPLAGGTGGYVLIGRD